MVRSGTAALLHSYSKALTDWDSAILNRAVSEVALGISSIPANQSERGKSMEKKNVGSFEPDLDMAYIITPTDTLLAKIQTHSHT